MMRIIWLLVVSLSASAANQPALSGRKTLRAMLTRATANPSAWFFDGATGTIVFTKRVVFDYGELSLAETLSLESLIEVGQWMDNGVTYDFRKTLIIVRGEKPDPLTSLAEFYSRGAEVNQGAISSSLSATEIVQTLTEKLKPDNLYFDDANQTFVVTGGLEMANNLDEPVATQVWDILAADEIWRSPSGQKFEFKQAPNVARESFKRHQRELVEKSLKANDGGTQALEFLQRMPAIPLLEAPSPCGARLVSSNNHTK